MKWKFEKFNSQALEITTNTYFDVERCNASEHPSGYKITPSAKSKVKISEEAFSNFQSSFTDHVEGERARDEMFSLVRHHFGSSSQRAANALEKSTSRKVSNRTVQAWLMPNDKPSSRRCPKWAVEALKSYVSDDDNQEELRRNRDKQEFQQSKLEYTDNNCVDLATAEIESERERLAYWKNASFTTLPVKLAEQDRQNRGYVRYLHKTVAVLDEAMESSTSFEEFKATYQRRIREEEMIENMVIRTKREIQDRTGDFANTDGFEPVNKFV